MNRGKLYFIAILFFVASGNAQEVTQKNLESDVREELKNYLLMKYDDIKISEIYSKNDDKESYLKKSLGNSLLKEASDVRAQDIYFKALSDNSETHLGVAYFYYETPIKAKNAIGTIEKKGFFENTKILTKYVAVNAGSVNLVFFTESSADKIVLGYLDYISSKASSAAGKK